MNPDSRHYGLVRQMNPQQKELSRPIEGWPDWAHRDAKIIADFESELPPMSNPWLEAKHFLPEQGKFVLACWVRKSGNTYRVCCRFDGKWRVAGTGKHPKDSPTLYKEIETP